MNVVSHTVACKECGALLEESPSRPPEQRVPCPSCGSATRTYDVYYVNVADGAIGHESLALSAKHGSTGRPFLKAKVGDDLFRKTGKWNELERRVDREKGWYYEKIVDPEIGKVIREVSEPLSQHRGRGSARRREDLSR